MHHVPLTQNVLTKLGHDNIIKQAFGIRIFHAGVRVKLAFANADMKRGHTTSSNVLCMK